MIAGAAVARRDDNRRPAPRSGPVIRRECWRAWRPMPAEEWERRTAAAPLVSLRALLAHVVDELDHLDGGLVILVRHRDEFLVLAVGETIERRLVLGRRFDERLRDRLFEVRRQVGQIGVGRAG